jgi:hypothetical protein
VRVFATKGFARFASKEAIDDEVLIEAIGRAERGLVDADLGGGLIKQRVSRPGEGKRGGFRAVIAYRRQDRAVFLYGFAKNQQENIGAADLKALKAYGAL